MELGERIRNLRTRDNMTLEDLSEKTGLSISYISNIERGVNSPTILNLQKICDAFRIEMPDLLENLGTKKMIIKKEDRREIVNIPNRVIYESISEGMDHISAVAMTVKGGSKIEEVSNGHDLDEFGVVAKGSLEMEVYGELYVLNEGDTIYLPAKTAHIYRNTSEEDSVSYWVYFKNRG